MKIEIPIDKEDLKLLKNTKIRRCKKCHKVLRSDEFSYHKECIQKLMKNA